MIDVPVELGVQSLPRVLGEQGWVMTRALEAPVVLYLNYKGHLTADDGVQAARRCVELMADDDVWLLFDLSELRSFPAALRVAWQDALWPRRGQVRGIVAACSLAIPRMALSAFALFIGTRAVLVERREELTDALDRQLAS